MNVLLAIIIFVGVCVVFWLLHREMDREHKLRIGKMEDRHERERQAFSFYRQRVMDFVERDGSLTDMVNAYRKYYSTCEHPQEQKQENQEHGN